MAAKMTFPKSQQLRFINKTYYPTTAVRYDTRLFRDFTFINRYDAAYCQKIEQTDNLVVQFRTTYPDFILTLRDKLTNTDTDYSGTAGAPIYSYTDSASDTVNVYNVTINVTALNGYYTFFVKGYSSGLPEILFESEPFEVREEHENTVLMKFGCNGSIADGMRWGEANYLLDYPQYLRIEGQMIDIFFSGEINKYIDSDSELTNLNNYPNCLYNLDFKEIPYYLVEKINLALQHDYFEIDGLQLNIDDDFETTNYKNMLFASGSIKLRQVEYENYTLDETLVGTNPTFPEELRTTGITDRTTGVTERKINN